MIPNKLPLVLSLPCHVIKHCLFFKIPCGEIENIDKPDFRVRMRGIILITESHCLTVFPLASASVPLIEAEVLWDPGII